MILVTGGAGFIGSHAVARLLATGEEVHAVDDLSVELVARERPSAIWHFAASSDISRGTAEPHRDLERTFLTTVHVLEAMRASGVRDLVFASSSAIYGETSDDVDEDHGPLQPISQYGAAKASSEAYISAYVHLYGLRAWIFRFPNVVGPNTPALLSVLGDGTQEKPYLHVDDLLSALERALREPIDTLARYNVAGEGSTTVRAIAEMVRQEMALPSARIEYGVGDRGWRGDVPRFGYDCRRIRALGWRPTRDSHQAVRAAIRATIETCRRSS